MLTIHGYRQRLNALRNAQFIDPDDFLARATSRQTLLRVDDAAAAVHGLLDPATGDRYYVENEKLDRWQLLPR
jgi:hypothetical protein